MYIICVQINATLVSARQSLLCTERWAALSLLFSFYFNRILAHTHTHTHTHRYFIYSYPSVYLSICLSKSLSPSCYLSIYLSIWLSIYPFFLYRSFNCSISYNTYTIIRSCIPKEGFHRFFISKNHNRKSTYYSVHLSRNLIKIKTIAHNLGMYALTLSLLSIFHSTLPLFACKRPILPPFSAKTSFLPLTLIRE